MQRFPLKLAKSLESRKLSNSFRSLKTQSNLIDFSSNDYLGFSQSANIYDSAHNLLSELDLKQNGASGSRLLSGNHLIYDVAEELLAKFHEVESALIFNSGYDANIGFFSAVPQRGDVIFYDELSHASIRDGINMSNAKSYKFKHNDLEDLKSLLIRNSKNKNSSDFYIVTESVFSMDGDIPDLVQFAGLSEEFGCFLIIDEAHATGIFGENGEGLVHELNLQDKIFAQINTFGKAMGCHGAVILGSAELRDYLINFSRSFIYTTALSPHSVATIYCAYENVKDVISEIENLKRNIRIFKKEIIKNNLQTYFVESQSAIQSCIIPGNDLVKKISDHLKLKGFDVKPILSPTVPLGKERLRFCVHSYNSAEEITAILNLLDNFAKDF